MYNVKCVHQVCKSAEGEIIMRSNHRALYGPLMDYETPVWLKMMGKGEWDLSIVMLGRERSPVTVGELGDTRNMPREEGL